MITDCYNNELIAIYKTEGENKVKELVGEENYDYVKTERYYDYDVCYLGYIQYLKPYKSYQEYKDNYVKDQYSKLEQQLQEALSEEYFNKTESLAKEYSQALLDFEVFGKEFKGRGKKFYNSPIYLKQSNFVQEHQDVINPLDIRFNHFIWDRRINDPQRPKLKMVSTFQDVKPEVQYVEYVELVKATYENQKESIQNNFHEDLADMNADFQEAVKMLKTALNKAPRVGLINLTDFNPRRHLEKEGGKISELTLDKYLNYKSDVVYWFEV